MTPPLHVDQNPIRHAPAFTFLELLVVIAIIVIFAGLFLPILSHSHGKGSLRIKCVVNLKQVGLAYRLWSGDNGDKFPMQMVVTNGGLIEPAFVQKPANLFQVMSNELSTPKILICPADAARSAAVNFTGMSNLQVSYFVGLDATETNPATLISGDRNITNGTRLHRGALELTTNSPAGWSKDIHHSCGNIGFADSSVQQLTTGNLRKAVQATGLATNRLAMP